MHEYHIASNHLYTSRFDKKTKGVLTRSPAPASPSGAMNPRPVGGRPEPGNADHSGEKGSA